jgi:ParG protein
MSKQNSRPVSKRVPVLIENATYTRFQTYCEQTGITVTHSVNEALNDWMDAVGAVRLEAFKKPGREILRESC